MATAATNAPPESLSGHEVPEVLTDEAKLQILPQVWSRSKFEQVRGALPAGVMLPHCTVNGDDDLPPASALDGALVVVVVWAPTGTKIQTAVVSFHLQTWSMTFTECLRLGMTNLRTKTKEGPLAAGRWENHPSGCGRSVWSDGFDAARCALLPSLVAQRPRPEGDAGGVVVLFAAPQCVLTAGSSNPLGLCWAGDVANCQIAQTPDLLSGTPYRLVKAPAPAPGGLKHPLRVAANKAGDKIWKWVPYFSKQGGTGVTAAASSQEYSVPRDREQADAILNAIENKQPVPIFTDPAAQKLLDEQAAAVAIAKKERVLSLKADGNAKFKEGDCQQALKYYGAALQTWSSIANNDDKETASVLHANSAACLLQLGGQENAALALKAALESSKLVPTYAKAYHRAAAALEALGEAEAAAESRKQGEALMAEEKAKKDAARAALAEKRAARDAKKKEKEEKEAAAKAKRDEAAAKAKAKADASAPAVPPVSGGGSGTTIKIDSMPTGMGGVPGLGGMGGMGGNYSSPMAGGGLGGMSGLGSHLPGASPAFSGADAYGLMAGAGMSMPGLSSSQHANPNQVFSVSKPPGSI